MKECLNCYYLGQCTEVDRAKLEGHYCCIRWKGIKQPLFDARLQSIADFGTAAVETLINPAKGE